MIYLDNAATSWPKPESVLRAMDTWHRTIGVGPSRGDSSLCADVGRRISRCRRELAALLGGRPELTAFTLNATDALNLAIKGLVRPGDHVVSTRAEHSSVVRPLRSLANHGVIDVTFVPVSEQGRVDPAAIRSALRPTTTLLVLSHASNVTGVIQDIASLAAIAREAGAVFLLDAAQTAGTIPIDMSSLGIDAVAVPGHKGLLGPQGTGALCLSRELPLRPLREGGTGSSRALDVQPDEFPTRLEAGTGNTPGVLGLLEGILHVRQHGPDILLHERTLLSQLADELAPCLRTGAIRWIGPPPDADRVAVASLTLSTLSPEEAGLALDAHQIAVRTGYHCAPYLHEALGTPSGTVRLSPGPYTTSQEITQAATVLKALAS